MEKETKAKLATAEKAIRNWEQSYYDACKAVFEVKEGKLYKLAGYKSLQKWIDSVCPGKFTRMTAYRMASWYAVNKDLPPEQWKDHRTIAGTGKPKPEFSILVSAGEDSPKFKNAGYRKRGEFYGKTSTLDEFFGDLRKIVGDGMDHDFRVKVAKKS